MHESQRFAAKYHRTTTIMIHVQVYNKYEWNIVNLQRLVLMVRRHQKKTTNEAMNNVLKE